MTLNLADIKIDLEKIKEEKAGSVTEFLEKLFDNLSGLIEVREIGKDGSVKKKFFKNWKETKNHRFPQDKNIYFGVFTRKNGSSGKKENCLKCQAVWADFDKIEENELKKFINQSPLPYPSMIVMSGKGYHCYWLLEEPAGKKVESILKEIAVQTGSDMKVADAARVMRLPDTNNIKYSHYIRCKVVEINNNSYSLQDLANKLNTVPKSKAMKSREKEYKTKYEQILSEINAPCIKSILEGVKEGQRNWALGRIVNYLRDVQGCSRRDTKKVIDYWNTLNKPPEIPVNLTESFNGYWHSEYNLLGCKTFDSYLNQLLQEHCNTEECGRLFKFKLDTNKKMVKYNNRIIKNISTINGTGLVLYGILFKNPEEQTVDELLKKVELGECTLRKNLKKLKSMGFVTEIKGIRRRGIKNKYKLNRQGTRGTGRTSISYEAVSAAADKDMTPAEFKVYLLLCWYNFRGNNIVSPSTFTLSEKLRISQPGVQAQLTSLKEKGFLQTEKTDTGKNIYLLKL